ncbi:MAG: hypothetical protein ACRDJP_00860 [Actinomycetota bacterium]
MVGLSAAVTVIGLPIGLALVAYGLQLMVGERGRGSARSGS